MPAAIRTKIDSGQQGHGSAADTWLSVLIPAYDVAPYLRACVESVTRQLIGDGVEIIVLADVSNDATVDVARTLADEFGHVQVLTPDRKRGLSAARNTMLDASCGTYIWFLDGDDLLLPGALAELKAIVAAHSPDLVLCDFKRAIRLKLTTFRGRSNALGTDGMALVAGAFASRRLHAWSKIARRELWADDLRFPVGKFFEDAATTPFLMLRARTFYHASRAWVYYRQRSDSIMATLMRSPLFDAGKADDLASALRGYNEQLTQRFGSFDEPVRYHVSDWCGLELGNIVRRVVKFSGANLSDGVARAALVRKQLAGYHATFASCAPMTFEELGRAHLRRAALYRWWRLRRTLALVRAGTA